MLGNNLFSGLNLIVPFVLKFQDMKRPTLPQNLPNVYNITFIILYVFTGNILLLSISLDNQYILKKV